MSYVQKSDESYSKPNTVFLRAKNITVDLGRATGKIIWARKVINDIYEMSFELSGKGFQLWFVRVHETGIFEPLCCSMYESELASIIRAQQDGGSSDTKNN